MTWVLRNMLIVSGAMVVLAGVAHYYSGRSDPTIGLVLAAGLLGLALLAVVDGARRALGKSSVLGRGRGLGRVLGGVQFLLGLGMLAGVVTSALGR